MNFRPYTKEDKLEVGTKIRLGGREGKIVEIYRFKSLIDLHAIEWRNGGRLSLELHRFTFEIEDIPLPPLKIDKRVKEEIQSLINAISLSVTDVGDLKWQSVVELESYINSLEEV